MNLTLTERLIAAHLRDAAQSDRLAGLDNNFAYCDGFDRAQAAVADALELRTNFDREAFFDACTVDREEIKP